MSNVISNKLCFVHVVKNKAFETKKKLSNMLLHTLNLSKFKSFLNFKFSLSIYPLIIIN